MDNVLGRSTTSEANRSVFVVIPVYNEAAALGSVLERLVPFEYSIVVVDDGSTDGSSSVARSKADWLIRHSTNLGQGAALQTGIQFSLDKGATYIVTFDSDGQHSGSDIPALLDALDNSQADYALGSRFLGVAPGIPWTRSLILRLGVVFTRVMSRINVSDTHNGLRAMTRRGAERIRLTMNRMEHASEILDQIAASKLRYVEVPVRIEYDAYTLAKGQRSSSALKTAAKLIAERMR